MQYGNTRVGGLFVYTPIVVVMFRPLVPLFIQKRIGLGGFLRLKSQLAIHSSEFQVACLQLFFSCSRKGEEQKYKTTDTIILLEPNESES